MEVKHTYAITHIETDKLSDFQQQAIEPFRDLLLKYVEDNTPNNTTSQTQIT